MRTGSEARQFFKKGRVFATLYTEPTGGTARPNRFNPAYTTVKFGASVYTQIRRFVVVSVRNNFVYAVYVLRQTRIVHILTLLAPLPRMVNREP